MSLFQRRKKVQTIPYDPNTQEPAVRKSICTGEMTAGFVNRATGKFTDYLLVHDQAELEAFCRDVGTDAGSIKVIY